MQGRPLTAEETNKRLLFIGKAVELNATLPTSLRFGQTTNMTVQDLVNSNVETLKKVGQGLEAITAKSGASRFSAEKAPEISGIPVSEWIDFVELTAIKKLNDAKLAQQEAEIKRLERELEAYETPEEKKAKLREQLAALKGTTVPATAEATA